MAMLALAHAAYPGDAIAATVDHGLRPEAADEAAMVARHCVAIGVPHATLRPDTAIAPANVQAGARHARYALLGDWAIGCGAVAVLTAHHLEDQAETFLMRALRGSGPAGLGGIRPHWMWEQHRWHDGYPRQGIAGITDVASIAVIRPLLNWHRAELAAIVTDLGWPSVNDPSNVDTRFDRVRIRQLMAQNPWLDPVGLARAAAASAEADAALSATMAWLTEKRSLPGPVLECRIDVSDVPRDLRRRMAREAIGYVRNVMAIAEGSWSDATNVESLLDALAAGKRATLAGVLASPKGDVWTFAAAPPRRSR